MTEGCRKRPASWAGAMAPCVHRVVQAACRAWMENEVPLHVLLQLDSRKGCPRRNVRWRGARQPSRSNKQVVRTRWGPRAPRHRTQSAEKETARLWFSRAASPCAGTQQET